MKLLRFAIFPLLILSCKHADKAPADLIPHLKMEQILLDVNVAEAYSATVKDTLRRPGSKNPDSLALYYKEIFHHYQISPEQFLSSLAWYKGHPEDLDTVYSNMIPLAEKWRNSTQPQPKQPANVTVPANQSK